MRRPDGAKGAIYIGNPIRLPPKREPLLNKLAALLPYASAPFRVSEECAKRLLQLVDGPWGNQHTVPPRNHDVSSAAAQTGNRRQTRGHRLQ